MDTSDGRPNLNGRLDVDTFLLHYYLKEELVNFCRENKIPASGSKNVLKSKVEHFLRTGERPDIVPEMRSNKHTCFAKEALSLETKIEENIRCSQAHRIFFESIIGSKFYFSVKFQRFLKSNPGRTYAEAINEWYKIEQEGKNNRGVGQIDSQFEYNKYIRDFFNDNKCKTLKDAITCWKYKRNLPGANNYERADLTALEQA